MKRKMWKSIIQYTLSAVLGIFLTSPGCVYLLDMSWTETLKAGAIGSIGGLPIIVYYQRKAKQEKEKSDEK